MSNKNNIDIKLDNLAKKLKWLIGGLGQHGLKLSDCDKISWEWIIRNYNVEDYIYKYKK